MPNRSQMPTPERGSWQRAFPIGVAEMVLLLSGRRWPFLGAAGCSKVDTSKKGRQAEREGYAMGRRIIWLLVSAIGVLPVHAQTEDAPLSSQAALPVDRHFDFFENAPKAYWQASGSSRLRFPGREGDQRGFARQLSEANLTTGEQVERLLQSHPEGRGRGWIQAIYPPLTLANEMRFRARIGFLAGTKESDGARFSVHVREGRQRFRLLSRSLGPEQAVDVEGDLSRWAGRTISVILRVNAGTSAVNDWAVWVNPRLEAKR